ncbi:MAG: hypothetical protein WC804_18505 [Sphingomonas sp.]|jgi:hypothetical protein|uniref:hypothetical protein n=1 Tax=Sphingomonas sp. TaxID=28214 RepID=UPI003569D629
MQDFETLWQRHWDIVDRHGNGYATPILWHLALRGHTDAMLVLSNLFQREGRIADPSSQAGLAYRAYRRGDALGAEHLAMTAFNRRDLIGYRYWLARAARAGNKNAALSLRRFEVRLPHGAARDIRRGRPWKEYD